jgi:Tfp pilus assembly protein PilV
MQTFLATLLTACRPRRRQSTSARTPGARATSASRRARLGDEEGFLLVEVLVSVMLVALIVVATLNGFDAATRVSADQRHHSQAALLAAQSQEQLRSDPASALDTLESAPHTFTKTINGTTYTVVQEAKPINSAGQAAACKFSETTAQNGAYIQVSSTVTWPQLNAAKRPAVKQASLVAPPTGSDLEVDVSNGAAVPAGVSGVTATASFVPVEAETPATIEGTTGSAGCVVLTGIPSTDATVAIAEKAGYVTPNGTLKVPSKELTIAPNITTHYPVTYNEAGKITAEYTYKGENPYKGTTVRSDTFVAYNVKIPAEPKFEVGSPAFEYKEVSGEEQYKALTTTLSTAATTPTGTKFAGGDLFPFSEKWQVYAGDCPANSILSATEATEKLTNPVGVVEPGKTTVVKVPLSYLTLNVKQGTTISEKGLSSTTYPVTITDTECAAARTPNNAFAANLKHVQNSNTEGHLSNPFQPYGKAELCLYNASASPARSYRTTTLLNDATVSGSAITIFPEELTKSERETKESGERTTWKAEQTAGKITLAQRQAKETTQTGERNSFVANEATRGYAIENKSC